MALNERERFELYERLSEVLGEENGGRLMEILPPTTWQDLATKADLAVLGAEVRTEFASVRGEMADIRSEVANSMRIMVGAQIGTFVVLFGLIMSLH